MPRRSSNSNGKVAGCLLLLAGIIFLVLFGRFLDTVRANPVAVGIPTLLVMAGAVYGGVLWVQQQNRAASRQQQIAFARSQEISRYHVMKPKEFEHAIGFLCQRDGCDGVRVVGGSSDLGADIIAIAPDGRKIVIQAKRYGPGTKVGGPDLQRFGGTCFTVHSAHIAVVVTTSVFTKQAREYSKEMGIHLFDEHRLAAWASRTGAPPWL